MSQKKKQQQQQQKKHLLFIGLGSVRGANRTLFRNKRSFIGTLRLEKSNMSSNCSKCAGIFRGQNCSYSIKQEEENYNHHRLKQSNRFIWNKVIISIFLYNWLYVCRSGCRSIHAFTTSIFFTRPSPIVWKSVKTADTLGTTKLGTCLDWNKYNKTK